MACLGKDFNVRFSNDWGDFSFFFQEIQLEIGVNEEMRSILGNKKLPQIFFYNSSNLQKYDLIRLIPHH